MEEQKKVVKMSVSTMSKKVVIGIVIAAVVLSIIDLARASQNETAPWIGKYIEEHYPNLFNGSSSDSSAASSDVPAEAVAVVYEEAVEESLEDTFPFDSDGFIFPDSDEEYLSEDDLYSLKDVEGYEFKDLLGFARNEIYARHGFPFNVDGKYYQLYSQYDWYNGMEHNDVSDGDLNSYETENIKLIVQIEQREGFR